MLEQEFQVLTAIEAGKILGGSGGVSTCPFASVSPVVTSDSFVGYYAGANCYDLAREQMSSAGVTPAEWGNAGNYKIFSQDIHGNSTTYCDTATAGVGYINCELQEGNPVMVGVNHGYYGVKGEANYDEEGKKANDGTDHFGVIVGAGIDDQGRTYYQFFDNATGYVVNGASSNNRLYYDPQIGTLIGSTAVPDYGSGNPYQVTMIRKNID